MEKFPRTDSGLEDYLQRLHEFPLLDSKEEVQLAQGIEVGKVATVNLILYLCGGVPSTFVPLPHLVDLAKEGLLARQQLWVSNLRLVVSIAKKYCSIAKKYCGCMESLEFSDLIQEGNCGLAKAMEKFDWKKGCKFSTYASWWIKEFVVDALRYQDKTIRIPAALGWQVSRYRKMMRKLNTDPGPEMAAKALGLKLERMKSVMETSQKNFRRRKYPCSGQGGLEEYAKEEAKPRYLTEDVISLLQKCLARLSDTESDVLSRSFGLEDFPRTTKEIANELGITEQAVRQTYARGLRKLRQNPQVYQLKDCL